MVATRVCMDARGYVYLAEMRLYAFVHVSICAWSGALTAGGVCCPDAPVAYNIGMAQQREICKISLGRQRMIQRNVIEWTARLMVR